MNSPETLPVPRRNLADLQITNQFASLPGDFYTPLASTPLPDPYLVCVSEPAAGLIGLDRAASSGPDFVQIFSGNATLNGSRPLAAVYSGHQFGVWAGQLGDGRALLLGETSAPSEPLGTLELQLKGSGKTPYSRMGDGRAVLRSSIREFLCSEAMAALGIPTSRALCVIGSDMRVMREMPEPTAVVTRMAQSFVRFGSFEHWFYKDRKAELQMLADYVIAQSYPELQGLDQPYRALLSAIARRTATLAAQWQAAGFMHGVLNTDNMSILGITLDYGPFGFMEAYNPAHICNHTDSQGRYAYRMQPQIAEWNCYALGQALLPLIGEPDDAYDALSVFKPAFETSMHALWQAKLGFSSARDNDKALIDRLLTLMAGSRVDFPYFFRHLSSIGVTQTDHDETLRQLFIDRAAFDAWLAEYRQRLQAENSADAARRLAMNRVNPKYVLRNYLAQIAIDKAHNKDFSEVSHLLKLLQHPFDEQPEHEAYAALPPDWAAGIEVSCSS
jgi:uncharacterized protein YdiU (UPF0061 family)